MRWMSSMLRPVDGSVIVVELPGAETPGSALSTSIGRRLLSTAALLWYANPTR